MDIRGHLNKAQRFERIIARLDDQQDIECIIEASMLASTAYINAALHKMNLTDPSADIVHSHTSVIPRDLGEEMNAALAALNRIEGLRPFYVRGGEAATVATGETALEALRIAKTRSLRLLQGV